MSADEDRLRRILQQEAADLRPAGDGLAVIRKRIARRRKVRLFVVPAAGLAMAGAAAAVFALSGTPGTSALVPEPAGSTTPSPESCRQVADYVCPTTAPTSVPSATPSSTAAPVTASGPVLSPYTSGDKDDVVRHWLAEAGVAATVLPHACESCDLVPLGVSGTKVADAALVRVDVGGERQYRLASVSGGDLVITSPHAGAAVTTPLSVQGTIDGVDEHVNVVLRTTHDIATGGAQAGSAEPWSATLTWTDTRWTVASLIAITRSAKDGSLNRVTAIPVTRATGTAASGASFAAVTGGHVSLYDAQSGSRLRQLTFPKAGSTDTYATWSAGHLAWVRKGSGSCSYALNQLDGGAASTVIEAGGKVLLAPQLSPSGALLAWSQTGCAGSSPYQVVVRGGGAPPRVIDGPSGMTVTVLDVRDDGALLLHLNDVAATDAGTVGLLPPGAIDLGGLKPMAAAGSCYLATAVAFDGQAPTAWETCSTGSRLVRFDQSGARTGAGALTTDGSPDAMSVRDHAVLVTLDATDGVGRITRYRDGRFSTVIGNAGCSTGSCIGLPDW